MEVKRNKNYQQLYNHLLPYHTSHYKIHASSIILKIRVYVCFKKKREYMCIGYWFGMDWIGFHHRIRKTTKSNNFFCFLDFQFFFAFLLFGSVIAVYI